MLPHSSQHERTQPRIGHGGRAVHDARHGDAIVGRDVVLDVLEQAVGEPLQADDLEVGGEQGEANEEEHLVVVLVLAEGGLQLGDVVQFHAREVRQRRLEARDGLVGEADGEGGAWEVVRRVEERREDGGTGQDDALRGDDVADSAFVDLDL